MTSSLSLSAIAVDVAATQLLVGGRYVLARENRSFRSSELIAEFAAWVDDYPIVSIEDALDEDDEEGWRLATARFAARIQLLGDDLFVTSSGRLDAGIREGIANAVLVKPNQIGTLSEARHVVSAAQDARLRHCPLCPLGRNRGQLARRPGGRLADGAA